MTLVFSGLWPESAITRLRGALADALRGIAALLRSPENAETNRQHIVEALARADNFEALSHFEIEMLARQTHLPGLNGIERLAGTAFVAAGEPLARDVDARAVATLSDWLDRAGQATAESRALPSLAENAATTGSGTAAQAAVSKLSIEAGRVATSAQ
jgi:hypothetical protein